MDLANLSIVSGFTVRDAVLLAIGAVAIYLLVALLRLSQVRQSAKSPAKPSAFSARPREERAEPEISSIISSIPPSENPWGDWIASGETARPPASADVAEGRGMAVESSTPTLSLFEFQLFRNNVDAELLQLRQELAGLREAFAQLNAARRISPQYNEAMLLAQRGATAQMIADQCAISLGEAELVAALGRDPKQYPASSDNQEYPQHDARYDSRH